MNDFEGQVVAELSVLKSQMAALIGAGQPGRLTALEHRVDLHERDVQRVKGFAAAFAALSTVVHFAVEYMRSR